jgi:hypothetical protein
MQHHPAHTLQPFAALMMEEAAEFEMLDALPPFDDCGNVAWVFEGEPTTRREKRWLELYTKLSARDRLSVHARRDDGQELTRFNPVSAAERSPSIECSAYPREPLRQIRHRHRQMCR